GALDAKEPSPAEAGAAAIAAAAAAMARPGKRRAPSTRPVSHQGPTPPAVPASLDNARPSANSRRMRRTALILLVLTPTLVVVGGAAAGGGASIASAPIIHAGAPQSGDTSTDATADGSIGSEESPGCWHDAEYSRLRLTAGDVVLITGKAIAPAHDFGVGVCPAGTTD